MNKLGFYIQHNQGVHEQINNIQPPVILIHAWDQGLLQEIRQFRSPNTLVVGRMDYIGSPGNQTPVARLVEQWLDSADPAAHGRALAEHILNDNFQLAQKRENGRLLVDGWMSLNECVPGPASAAFGRGGAERAEIERRLRAYDRFQVAFRNKLMEHGIEAVAFNFGAGNFTEASHYLDYLPETLNSYTYLGFHEYGWPALTPALNPGAASSAGSYRPIIEGIRRRTGRAYKVIMTEAGLARMYKHQDGAGDVGWLYPPDSVSQEEYFRSLDWFNDYMVQDDYVIGACLFQVGHGAGWETFRLIGQDNQGQPIQILSRVRELRDKQHHVPAPVLAGGANVATPAPSPVVTVTNPGNGAAPGAAPLLAAPTAGRVPVKEKVGIDANRPINPQTGEIEAQVANPDIISSTGVGWVRLNFVLGQKWPNVADPGWQATYRQIIGGFRARGLKIYGLISDEAMPAPPANQFRNAPPSGQPQDEWINRYADTFVTIARAFHQDVALFESFNEPDDWHGGNNSWIHPEWFAVILQAIHDRVRADPEIRHIKLISGPLQGLHNADDSHNNNGGAKYLRAAYKAGKSRSGWGSSKPFPFDGVGYHLYVAQKPQSTDQTIRQKYNEYLDELRTVIREEEGADKPIYLSEYGWFSNHGNEAFQQQAMQTGMALALDDPSLGLVIWFCTQDFDPEDRLKYYGLYRKDPIGANGRKPVYEIFRAICQQQREVPVAGSAAAVTPIPVFPPVQFPRIYTNQQVINACAYAADRLGIGKWDLLSKAGQDVARLVEERNALYNGPALEEVAAYSAAERSALLQELLGELLLQVRWVGLVMATAGLNLRAGPGATHQRIGGIPHDERVQVLHEQDGWLFVAWQGQAGYVSAEFVAQRAQPVVEPAPAPVTPGRVSTLQEIWNLHGGLLTREAAQLGIDPAVAIAVLLAESGGRTSGADGRMIIRFENHIFYDRWGRQNPDAFFRFFEFDREKRWQGHRWRRSPNDAWRQCHSSQAEEWAVLDLARSMHEELALQSISMGAAQIMGFNFSTVGHTSATAMFKDFQQSQENQIRGFFRFVAGKGLVNTLRNQDYLAFAHGYNGPGQAEVYRRIIVDYLDQVRRELGAQIPTGRALAPIEPIAARGLQPLEAEAMMSFNVDVDLDLVSEDDTRGLQPFEAEAAMARLPLPVPPDKTLATTDPALYQAWRKHIEQGFQNNQTMFDQVLKGFMNPYWTTVWMYRLLFAVGILAFVAAIVMAYVTQNNPTTAIASAAIFGGLGVIAFLSYFLSRPLQALEENLQFITWLGIIYNSYWTRLAYITELENVQADIEDVTNDTIESIQVLLDKHAEVSSKRPGLK
jgi:hypothetical protein